MKILTLLVSMFVLGSAFSSEVFYSEDGKKLEIKCEVELQARGIWWTECPRGALSAGTDAQVTRVPFVQTRVSCYVPKVNCVAVEVDDNEL